MSSFGLDISHECLEVLPEEGYRVFVAFFGKHEGIDSFDSVKSQGNAITHAILQAAGPLHSKGYRRNRRAIAGRKIQGYAPQQCLKQSRFAGALHAYHADCGQQITHADPS